MPHIPRYPVYVISKGRANRGRTAQFLIKDGIPFHLVVEPQEREDYARVFGEERLLELPFSNLGQGSIPARNWVWEHAKASGVKRHWILDDNIRHVYRLINGYRLPCDAGPALFAAEEFVERYENVAIAGLNYDTWIRDPEMPPFYLNVHVYSCLLILNELPHRWRGRYNEDTDLCLQVLSDGWCTVLFNAFLIGKIGTMRVPGGNMTELYQGDGRLRMARSLERAWPYVVETKRRFHRPQHVVRDSWRKFDTPLKRRPDVDFDALPATHEFGMVLREVREVQSPELRSFIEDHKDAHPPK